MRAGRKIEPVRFPQPEKSGILHPRKIRRRQRKGQPAPIKAEKDSKKAAMTAAERFLSLLFVFGERHIQLLLVLEVPEEQPRAAHAQDAEHDGEGEIQPEAAS